MKQVKQQAQGNSSGVSRRAAALRSLPNGVKLVHSRSVGRLDQHLSNKLSWYRRWHESHYHKVVHYGAVAVYSVAIGIILSSSHFAHASGGSWTQTDWSGGVGTSTTNQYSAATNVDTTVSGQASLASTAGWASTYAAWSKRQAVTITNSGSAQTDYQVRLSISYASAMNADFSDIRFTNNAGTALPYWVQTETNSTSATVWVKVDSLAASTTTNIYMYYGDSAATSASNGNNVFLLFDDFNTGSTLDNTKWSVFTPTNLYTITGGQLVFGPGNSAWNQAIYSTAAFARSDLSFEMDYKWNTNPAGQYSALMMGWDTAAGSSYTNLVYGYYNQGNCTSPCPVLVYENGGLVTGSGGGSWVPGTQYETRIRMRASGGAYYDQSTDAGNTWINSYNDTNSVATNLHPGWAFYNGSHNVDNARVRKWMATEPTASFGSEQQDIASSGTLTSAIYDSGVAENWGNLTFNATVPAGTSLSIKVRTGNQSNLSDATTFASCGALSSGSDMTSSCVPDKSRYAQYQVTYTGPGSATAILQDLTLNFAASDIIAPPTNASGLAMFRSNGGASVASNGWDTGNPYFTWTAGADDAGGSGIAGYCLYLGQDSTGNPVTTKGDLGTSPLNTGGACQFAVSGTNLDTSLSGYIATALTSSTSPYYFNIKAIDNAGNVYAGSSAQFQFKYDNVPPSNPSFISAPSEFVSSKQVTLIWPTTGADAPADDNSGLAGLQYRIGSSGTWYGANHNGAQDATDLLTNNGSYTTVSSPDFSNLVEGNNLIYFRTWDNAGNISPAYVTTVIKINTASPSSPQNVTATPSTNTTNSFAFSWLAPASYTGSASNITYCYTVNVIPNSSNCNYTAAGQTSLDAGAYATEPGDNTFYVVAKDEAGNINYATDNSTTFTANTPAPGIPLDIDIADISVKATSTWKLALSWEPPTDIGSGVSTYKVFRSTNGTSYTDIASTAGASYVDTGLSQVLYYYKVQACDSANNCGGFTTPVSFLPTGKFTSPANLISGPSVNATTRTAAITWTTDRASDSSVEFGTSPGQYFSTEAANASQVTSHSVTLNNLNAGTTYYYRAQWTDTDGNVGTSDEQSFTTLPAPTVSNVSTGNINLATATIQFTSNYATAVQLQYGGGVLSSSKVLNTSTATSTYSIPLSGLNPGTVYTFKLNPYDTSGNIYDNPTAFSFTTPPQPQITNVQFQPVPGALTGSEQMTWTTNVPATSEITYGLAGGATQNQLDTNLMTSHSMTIDNLAYSTQYSVTAISIDGLGNTATSDLQVFKSGTDTRPPKVSDLTTQPSIVGNGSGAKGQLIVSWKTDKAGTSQVAYGQGSSGDYSTKTAEDTALVTNHVVVVSGLATSEVYHVQVLSKDAEGVQGVSGDQTTIIGQASDNALSIVFNALQSIFGL